MYEVCHRCRAELPQRVAGAEALLFCAHCSAPQIMLPEHMRVENELPTGSAAAAPPPAVGQGIEWSAVLPTAAWVAVVGGLMSVVAQKSGFVSGFVSKFSPLWVLASGSLVLAGYMRRRPDARINGLAGWRIGLVTGLLLIGAKGAGLSVTGVVARFATHSMAGYDQESAKALASLEAMQVNMQADPAAKEMLSGVYRGLRESPEQRAGWVLGGAALQAFFLLIFAGLGGLFSGAVERRRRLVTGRG